MFEILMFFLNRHASWILPTICFVLPILAPVIFWDETLFNSYHLTIMRVVINFHIFFLINSAAHMWGNKPYDQFIMSTESNTVSLATLGEGYHNYHHVFPWDYRCTEIGNSLFNYTRVFIDFFAWIGWAYDLKVASKEIVKKRAERTGDGSLVLNNKGSNLQQINVQFYLWKNHHNLLKLLLLTLYIRLVESTKLIRYNSSP